MPRRTASGATAALTQALAARGVHASAYQIERWRAEGVLPRPRRRGLGRGRGTVSEPPDEQTIQTAMILAKASRQGSPRVGSHVIERLGLGLPVAVAQVRAAFTAELNAAAQMVAADVDDEDAGWQKRDELIDRVARKDASLTCQGLIDAVTQVPEPPTLSLARKRAAVAGMIHAMGAGDEALSTDLLETFSLYSGIDDSDMEAARRVQVAAELAGMDPWPAVARHLSIRHMRTVLDSASLDDLRRAAVAFSMVQLFQTMIVMFGVWELGGIGLDMPVPLDRFNAAMVRSLQADPMWGQSNRLGITINRRLRVRQLALPVLGILSIEGQLEAWEAYRDRLSDLLYPNGHPE